MAETIWGKLFRGAVAGGALLASPAVVCVGFAGGVFKFVASGGESGSFDDGFVDSAQPLEDLAFEIMDAVGNFGDKHSERISDVAISFAKGAAQAVGSETAHSLKDRLNYTADDAEDQ
jgi:hypothetical protein